MSEHVIAGALAPRPILKRGGLIVAAVFVVLAVAALAGARYGLLLAVGLGFGLALEGLRFGFAGPWRAMILRREPSGLWAQLLAIGIVTVFALPLIANHGGELNGAQAPIGFAMIAGAFVFGVAMQVVLGCGSGTLVNAGSGNPVSLVALPFFAIGSFAGAYHLFWWTGLGALPIMNFEGWSGVLITLGLLFSVAMVAWKFATPQKRVLPRRLVIAAVVIAALALANLLISGQPWGVVYGLGLWVAKGAVAAGVDLSGSAFWAAPATAERVTSSVLTDYTSLTDIGIILGAFFVASWRVGGLSAKLPSLPARAWVGTIVAGFLLGYSSRLAFGCNVGAFFSGISTGSLHGWVWFGAAFVGSIYGIKLRPILGLEARS
ncbi:YeeE/YedE family protein [Marivivens donghaensis]|uniref:YeeE/YedE family protein n=1 Tax=Marivivens donghaensis TaxID=1699413 RepID=UPI00201EF71D|nr:YeeE/YedE family protein [Marivivens donghaensis]MCL7410064.1 YeeE/YedE family protein [Marivivens donghaensis]MDN3703356.1 YeeE/YedE family protein [Marivivens donghaensis]